MRIVRDLTAAAGRFARWWSEDLWSAAATSNHVSSMERFGVTLARTLYIVFTGFRTERIKLRAALLTYVTLLSCVPAAVVTFSAFAAFRGLGDVQLLVKQFVVRSLAVGHQDTLLEYLDAFVERAGTIGAVGIGVLLVTTIMLLGNIEKAFNDIWGVRRGRTLLHRFQVYWPLVTLGPILLGLSLSLTAAVQTSDTVQELVKLTPSFNLVFKLLPILFTCTFLTLLYMFLPHTHVPARAAIAGGVIAGALWELAKLLYAVYAGYALSVPSVYGSLAAVPLFILWIYVTWVVALLGATLTFAVQNARTYEPEALADRRRSQRDREFLAARLLVAVSDSFDRGSGPVTAQVLLDQVVAPPRFVRRVLSELVEAKLLVETISTDTEESAFVPGRPLHTISVADIVRAMRGAKSEVATQDGDALDQRVLRALMQAEDAVDERLGMLSLAQILAEVRVHQAAQAVSAEADDPTTEALVRR